MMRTILFVAAIVAAMAFVPRAQAQFKAGDYTLALSGSGSHSPDFDGATIAVQGELGYFLNNALELSLRQQAGYTDITGGGSAWSGYTALALDYHFDMGRWQPYIGANIGYIYGDVSDSWIAGPEAGIKFFVNNTTYIQVGVEYEFFLSESISDGEFQYRLAVGFKL